MIDTIYAPKKEEKRDVSQRFSVDLYLNQTITILGISSEAQIVPQGERFSGVPMHETISGASEERLSNHSP